MEFEKKTAFKALDDPVSRHPSSGLVALEASECNVCEFTMQCVCVCAHVCECVVVLRMHAYMQIFVVFFCLCVSFLAYMQLFFALVLVGTHS